MRNVSVVVSNSVSFSSCLWINAQAEQHGVPIAKPAQIPQVKLKAKQPRIIIIIITDIVHQELAIKCGLSKGAPMLCYKYGPQSVLVNSSYKPYYDRPLFN